jgi:hypothetical protein
MHYIHIKFSCSTYIRSHNSNIYLQHQSHSIKDISASKRRERPWTTIGGLLPPSRALALIERQPHHHRLSPGLLLRLLSGLLISSSILILPSSIDISNQCGVVIRPSSSAEILSQLKAICFLTFKSKNERIHLVIILNNWNLKIVHMSSSLWCDGIHRCSLRRSRRSCPGVSEEEEAPPTSWH